MLLARSILLCYLCMALGGTWMIEQPASSRLPWFPRFEKMLLKVRGLAGWVVGPPLRRFDTDAWLMTRRKIFLT